TRRAGVRVLILVEDSPLYRSFFLPLIYREVVHQTQSVLEESLNEEHRLLKMRARPKIMVAENYEQALSLFNRFQPFVFGVISDTRFPMDNQVVADAGARLLEKIKARVPHLPMLLLSSESENRQLAENLQIQFVDKNSPRLAAEVQNFFLDYLGFGDFVFRLPDKTEIGRAGSFKELEKILPEIPDEPIYYQAMRHRFSNWFMARSEIALASVIARIPASDFHDISALRQFLINSIHVLRKNRQKGVVVQFSPAEFDPAISDFVKIGNGSLGGKARGLAFFTSILQKESTLTEKYPGIKISVPGTLVVATEGFDSFIAENDLKEIGVAVDDDHDIEKRFLNARLPTQLADALIAYLKKLTGPVSVRSSGLFEDAYFQPYSGLYKTYMVPNNHPDFEVRREQLFTAVKLVYASTFFKGPLTFKRSTRYHLRRDSMALMIQQLAGTVWGDYFYPAISGVARSKNYYPVAGMQSNEGVVRIALGMGKTVDEGEGGLRFSPRYPEILPQFSKLEDILENAQYRFYALKVKDYDEKLGFHRGTNLELRDISDAGDEYPVKSLCST
ncbi:MAG: phosphoenolpyruvate synthase/pyruvate phosphate dikinase, partial [Desulfobacterales bacterium]|nr:phosphoenolpyruvate synthase/pyruvate phosphate dikinase [Desulfobacterales bacterium]